MNQEPLAEEHTEVASELERYIELCIRMYERMERENSWPWEMKSLQNGNTSASIQTDRNVSPSGEEPPPQGLQGHR